MLVPFQIVLCPHSQVFKAMLQGNFKEVQYDVMIQLSKTPKRPNLARVCFGRLPHPSSPSTMCLQRPFGSSCATATLG